MSLSFVSRPKKIITQFYKPTTFIPAKLKKRNLAIVYAYLWNNETSYGKHNYNVLFGIVLLRRNATLYRLRFLSVRVVRQYVHAGDCNCETISRVAPPIAHRRTCFSSLLSLSVNFVTWQSLIASSGGRAILLAYRGR